MSRTPLPMEPKARSNGSSTGRGRRTVIARYRGRVRRRRCRVPRGATLSRSDLRRSEHGAGASPRGLLFVGPTAPAPPVIAVARTVPALAAPPAPLRAAPRAAPGAAGAGRSEPAGGPGTPSAVEPAPARTEVAPGRENEPVAAGVALSDERALLVGGEPQGGAALTARPTAGRLSILGSATGSSPRTPTGGAFLRFLAALGDIDGRGLALIAPGLDRPIAHRPEGERLTALRTLRRPFGRRRRLDRRRARGHFGGARDREGDALHEGELVLAGTAGTRPKPNGSVGVLDGFAAVRTGARHCSLGMKSSHPHKLTRAETPQLVGGRKPATPSGGPRFSPSGPARIGLWPPRRHGPPTPRSSSSSTDVRGGRST